MLLRAGVADAQLGDRRRRPEAIPTASPKDTICSREKVSTGANFTFAFSDAMG
jgi:hypothetical protein